MGFNQGARDWEEEFDWGQAAHLTGGKWPTFGVA